MSWFYNSNTGVINDYPQDTVLAHLGLGWHGPFKTRQNAVNYYNTNKGKNPGWKAPFSQTGIGGIPNALGNGASSIVDRIGQFNVGGWFIRIGEILLGLVLIGVGVARLTNADTAFAKALKVAPMAAL